jgi:hypothetical protein
METGVDPVWRTSTSRALPARTDPTLPDLRYGILPVIMRSLVTAGMASVVPHLPSTRSSPGRHLLSLHGWIAGDCGRCHIYLPQRWRLRADRQGARITYCWVMQRLGTVRWCHAH